MLKSLLDAPLSNEEKAQSFWDATKALFSSKSQTVLTSPTVPALGKRVCVFAHFDVMDRVDPHVFHHLRAFQSLGFDTIFVSTCRRMKEADRRQLLTICHKVILRKNNGYDFGSYRAGIREMLKSHDYEQIVLTNDSVYGPLHDLKSIFDDLAQRPIDIWSITDSYEHEYHLQSYFLVFSRKAWNHPLIQRFWNGFWHVKNKGAAIHLYEIGLSRAAKKARLQLGAWCDTTEVIETSLKKANTQFSAISGGTVPHDEIEKRRLLQLIDVSLGSNCNVSHFYWEYLIRDFRCPYLKVELLRDNPCRVPNVHFYRDFIPDSYPHELIREHLRRYGR